MRRLSWTGFSVVGALIAVFACRHKAEPQALQARPSGPTGAATAATAPPSAAPSAATAAPRVPPPAEALLMAWSSALSRHAVDELASFYAPQVVFYGRHKTAAEVVAAKRVALEKAPRFRQSVSDVKIDAGPNGFVLRFTKLSGDGPLKAVDARLVLESSQNKLVIVEESDAPTDQRTAPPTPTTCAEAVGLIVGSHPVIAADVARVAREYPEVNAGGMSYDQVDRPDHYSASQGYFHEDRYEPRWWIEAADGVLTIRDTYQEQPLVVTAKQQAIVRKLCTGKADPEP